MLFYCYEAECDPDEVNLVVLGRVFAMAEKYFVRGPAECATMGFMWTMKDADTTETTSLERIVTNYTETSDSDRMLKDKIVAVMLEESKLLEGGNKYFDRLRAQIPEFSTDMIKAFAQARFDQQKAMSTKKQLSQRFRCPGDLCADFTPTIQDESDHRDQCINESAWTMTGEHWKRLHLRA